MEAVKASGPFHTPESLRQLTNGTYEDRAIRDLLTEAKHGLRPVEAGVLIAAAQAPKLDRLLELADPQQEGSEGPTQADQIQKLLETVVVALEKAERRQQAMERLALAQDRRLDRIERALSSTVSAPRRH